MIAAASVFDTYELLEWTLLHLPLFDILLAQRVCKNWNSIINRSLNIQQVLFMRPSSETTVACHPKDEERLAGE